MRRLSRWWQALEPATRRSVALLSQGLAGLGLLTAGCGLIYAPLALIVPGVLLLADAVWEDCR